MLNRENFENKARHVTKRGIVIVEPDHVVRVARIVDEHACDAESSRMEKGGTQLEIAEITALAEDGSATACLIRFNGRPTVALSAEMIAGLDLRIGSRLMLRVKRPEFAGFRGNTQGWQTVAVVQIEEPQADETDERRERQAQRRAERRARRPHAGI